jgi:lysophospholipase L1-like esterase
MKTIKKGDYVLMQFGHNDGGELADTLRARGTIKGIGEETKDIYNPIRKVNETVYTYGHYMRKYAQEAKAKGAIPIIVSPIPRNEFDKNGKIGKDQYGVWAQEVAKQTGAYFIDLNKMVIEKYQEMGPEKVKAFFPKDHTHTNREGAILNAELVTDGIKSLKSCELKKYIK